MLRNAGKSQKRTVKSVFVCIFGGHLVALSNKVVYLWDFPCKNGVALYCAQDMTTV